MNSILLTMLETAVCMIVFYIAYRFLLSRDTFFQFNRAYLNVSLILSFVIPVLSFERMKPTENLTEIMLDSVTVSSGTARRVVGTSVAGLDWLVALYFAGAIVFLIIFILKLVKIAGMIRGSKSVYRDGVRVILTAGDITPCSFLNYIFINWGTYQRAESIQIITHELVHIRQKHSWDMIFLELVSILQWFNPIIHFYKKSMTEIHEYIADRAVIGSGIDFGAYQHLIIDHSFSKELSGLANNFNKSIIIRRLKMLKKIRTKKLKMIKIGLLLPVLGLMLLAFSCQKEQSADSSSANLAYVMDDNGQPQKPDVYPTPKGNWTELENFLASNLVIPEEAAREKITGKINVEFFVEPDGSITNIKIANAKEGDKPWAQKLGYGCDEEALRVVKKMPAWNPAVYKGKPVRMKRFVSVLIGDKEVWEAKNPPSLIGENLGMGDTSKMKDAPDFEYPGGYQKMLEFIGKNIKYPESGRANNISGTVYTSFVVDQNGKVTDVKVEKGINPDFDNEALRVIRMMPDWVPDKAGKSTAKLKMTLPIKFKLQ